MHRNVVLAAILIPDGYHVYDSFQPPPPFAFFDTLVSPLPVGYAPARSSRSNNHIAQQLCCTRLAYRGSKYPKITIFTPSPKFVESQKPSVVRPGVSDCCSSFPSYKPTKQTDVQNYYIRNFQKVCYVAYTGCVDDDDCSSSPCMNGADCRSVSSGFVCSPCPLNVTGRRCQFRMSTTFLRCLFTGGSQRIPNSTLYNSIGLELVLWIRAKARIRIKVRFRVKA